MTCAICDRPKCPGPGKFSTPEDVQACRDARVDWRVRCLALATQFAEAQTRANIDAGRVEELRQVVAEAQAARERADAAEAEQRARADRAEAGAAAMRGAIDRAAGSLESADRNLRDGAPQFAHEDVGDAICSLDAAGRGDAGAALLAEVERLRESEKTWFETAARLNEERNAEAQRRDKYAAALERAEGRARALDAALKPALAMLRLNPQPGDEVWEGVVALCADALAGRWPTPSPPLDVEPCAFASVRVNMDAGTVEFFGPEGPPTSPASGKGAGLHVCCDGGGPECRCECHEEQAAGGDNCTDADHLRLLAGGWTGCRRCGRVVRWDVPAKGQAAGGGEETGR